LNVITIFRDLPDSGLLGTSTGMGETPTNGLSLMASKRPRLSFLTTSYFHSKAKILDYLYNSDPSETFFTLALRGSLLVADNDP